jgi:hypothetical protein
MASATSQNITAAPPLHPQSAAVALLPAAPPLRLPPPAPRLTFKPCPFCLEEPDSDRAFHGRAVIYCNNDDCPACPQVTAATIEAAAKAWNHRYYPGFVAPEVRQ